MTNAVTFLLFVKTLLYSPIWQYVHPEDAQVPPVRVNICFFKPNVLKEVRYIDVSRRQFIPVGSSSV